jgi:hypothetical protein
MRNIPVVWWFLSRCNGWEGREPTVETIVPAAVAHRQVTIAGFDSKDVIFQADSIHRCLTMPGPAHEGSAVTNMLYRRKMYEDSGFHLVRDVIDRVS